MDKGLGQAGKIFFTCLFGGLFVLLVASYFHAVYKGKNVTLAMVNERLAELKAGESTCVDVERVLNDPIFGGYSKSAWVREGETVYQSLIEDVRTFNPMKMLTYPSIFIQIWMKDCIIVKKDAHYSYTFL